MTDYSAAVKLMTDYLGAIQLLLDNPPMTDVIITELDFKEMCGLAED